jgi:molybdenum cofactor biosynthesis protein B
VIIITSQSIISIKTHILGMPREHRDNIPVQAAIITVSTTRTEKTDISGKIIYDSFMNADIPITSPEIVKDDIPAIRKAVMHAMEKANCIIVNGGTGLTHDDCTIEAVSPLFLKTIDGFGELFRWKSYSKIGNSVILSRAAAGINNGRAVFCIPGSPDAVKLAVTEIILPEIRHILTHAGQ